MTISYSMYSLPKEFFYLCTLSWQRQHLQKEWIPTLSLIRHLFLKLCFRLFKNRGTIHEGDHKQFNTFQQLFFFFCFLHFFTFPHHVTYGQIDGHSIRVTSLLRKGTNKIIPEVKFAALKAGKARVRWSQVNFESPLRIQEPLLHQETDRYYIITKLKINYMNFFIGKRVEDLTPSMLSNLINFVDVRLILFLAV